MRRYTIILTEPGHEIWDTDKVTQHIVEASCMKTLDKAIVLMNWHDDSQTYREVASFSYGDGVSIAITSTSVG